MGLQCFSLKSFNLKGKSVSAFQKIYLIAILVLSLACTCCWLQMGFDYVNPLNSVLNIIMALLMVLGSGTSLVVSYWKHHVLVDFFQKSQTISTLTKLEFNSDIHFEKLNHDMNKMMCKFIFNIISLKLIYVILVFYNENNFFYSLLISLIPSLVINVAVLRFGFYVCIINFHLKSLKSLIFHHFCHSIITQNIERNHRNRIKNKILKLRKIYSLIEVMAKNVNDSLGLTVLFFLCLLIVSLLRYGYEAFVIATKSLPVKKYESEIFEI